MSLKPLVIYHKNCLDGFAAAWCFHRIAQLNIYPQGIDFHAASYNKEPPNVRDRDVFIVDFSYPRDVTEKMLQDVLNLTILDHHESAIRNLEGLVHYKLKMILDKSRSGARIAWDFCFGNWAEPPMVLKHIEDRDLWLFHLPNTRHIAAVVALGGFDFKEYDKLMLDPDMDRLIEAGMILDKHQQKAVKDLANHARPMVIGGHMVPCVNAPFMFASDIGNLLSEDVPFAASYFDSEHSRMFSLRSRPGGLNVSLIAERYNGGGHEHAAGFKVDRDHDLAKS
jgi:oligoribonuclease NrnB/cAMP/cGMP phosphodiesterase (DHH superfamily)